MDNIITETRQLDDYKGRPYYVSVEYTNNSGKRFFKESVVDGLPHAEEVKQLFIAQLKEEALGG